MRAFIACIVALSIPLQGLASTFMLHCGAGSASAPHAKQTSVQHMHSGHDATVAQAVGTVTANDHRHGDTRAHVQTHKQMQIPAQATDADDESSSTDRASCAVCCAALMTQVTQVAAPDLRSEQPLPLVLAATPERNPGGIERPPRHARY